MFYLEFTPQVPSSIILFSLDTLSPSYCFVPPFFKLLLMRTWPFFDISTQHLPSSICYFFHRIPFHLPAASSLYFSSCYSCAQGRFLTFQSNTSHHPLLFFHRISFRPPTASSLHFSSCYSCAQGRFLIFQNNSIIHCYFFTGYPFAFLSLLSSIFQVVTHAYRAVF